MGQYITFGYIRRKNWVCWTLLWVGARGELLATTNWCRQVDDQNARKSVYSVPRAMGVSHLISETDRRPDLLGIPEGTFTMKIRHGQCGESPGIELLRWKTTSLNSSSLSTSGWFLAARDGNISLTSLLNSIISSRVLKFFWTVSLWFVCVDADSAKVDAPLLTWPLGCGNTDSHPFPALWSRVNNRIPTTC